MKRIPDLEERERAVATFDGTVVVTASAGTGKTTLLVERALHLLLGERAGKRGLVLPVAPEALLAVTFGEKAAGSMREKLRAALVDLAGADAPRSGWLAGAVRRIERVHDLSPRDLRSRARALLPSLDRAQISTLHSLAAEVLRAFPREAGVDPRFDVDEGEAFETLFEERWEEWLGRASETGDPAARERWMRALAAAGEEGLREAARALGSFSIPDEVLDALFEVPRDGAFREWLSRARSRAQDLAAMAKTRKKPRKVEKAVLACERFLGGGGGEPRWGDGASREELDDLGKLDRPVEGWEERHADAKDLLETTRRLARYDPALGKDFAAILLPFARAFREEYGRLGFVSFDGLLTLACRVLRDDRRVRERLKRRYRAILVDEFQDTDPAQVEMVAYLAEEEGTIASRAEDVRFAQGKLFVVGDEKQSIYAFRGADPAACRDVARRAREAGTSFTLRASFRSAPEVLGPVNEVFSRLFEEGPFQAPYSPLEAAIESRSAAGPQPRVEIRLWHGGEEGWSAEEAAAAEAEAVAEVVAQLKEEGFEWSRIAILLRAFTRGHVYLGALQRRGIPYTSEGEKFFYTSTEVLDFVNLLAALADPHDRLALAGVLRSPLGALSDRDLADLAHAGALDLRLDPPEGISCAKPVRALYEGLRAAREEFRTLPLERAVDGLFERFPLLEIAGASFRGAQTAANLSKLRVLARSLAADPRTTLPRLVAVLRARGEKAVEEGEAPVFEEGVEAVRVLTIHKAKGLEFDAVVLPATHAGAGGRNERQVWARFDRLVATAGLKIGSWETPAAVFVEGRQRRREEAEKLRVRYVGWTRARARLVVSGALASHRRSSFLDVLYGERVFGEPLPKVLEASAKSERERVLGAATIREILAPAPPPARGRRGKEVLPFTAPEVREVTRACAAREAAFEEARRSPLVVAASALGGEEEPPDEPDGDAVAEEVLVPARLGSREDGDRARVVGTLCHRLLERWSFGAPLEGLGSALEEAAEGEGIRGDSAGPLLREARELLEKFLRSPLAARLGRVEILGRELPILVRLGDRFVHGAADLVFGEEGRVVVADYKTDDVDEAGAARRAETYAEQCRAYAEAVRCALGLAEVRAALLFLRPCVAVETECASRSRAGAS
jgi:ATP-dependent helicase/nuclease subunit A